MILAITLKSGATIEVNVSEWKVKTFLSGDRKLIWTDNTNKKIRIPFTTVTNRRLAMLDMNEVAAIVEHRDVK